MIRRHVRTLIDRLSRESLLRDPRIVERVRGPVVRVDGKTLISFCDNDYLGLAQHPALGAAAAGVAHQEGWGGHASRLLSGTTPWHTRLEARMAEFRRTEAALYFSSGYLANLGLLAGLGTEEVTYFSDELNHASVIDGIRLAKARHHVYRHADVGHVRELLARADTPHRVIVTDAVFSMDGDIAPLRELAALDADLFIDDAHGTGVLGRGTPEHLGVSVAASIVTLSKAAGASGGFVAADRDTITLLKTRARPFVYSTAPPPAVCAAAMTAIDLMEKADDRRRRLSQNVAHVRSRLDRPGETPIIPWVVGSAEDALAAAARLWEKGFLVPAIRPPTVPTSRLRISLTALHELEHLDGLLDALASL